MKIDAGQPAVSILTAAFNSARTLAHTIESALAQTMPSFEMIIVDDGSTDDTRAVAERFAERDPRIRLIHQPNGGTAAARNAAIEAARGDCFALLDSDDRWSPRFLEAQLRVLETDPTIDIVSCNALNDGGRRDGEPLKPPNGPIRAISLLELIEIEDSVTIMAVFRRRVIETAGLFDTRLRRNEDYDLWLRAVAAGLRIVFNPEPLAYYRRRHDSVSANEATMLDGISHVLRSARPLCEGRPAELKALDQQLRRFERRRLVLHAKSALLAGDFPSAADAFKSLNHRFGDASYAALALLSRNVPTVVRGAYAFKLALWKALR